MKHNLISALLLVVSTLTHLSSVALTPDDHVEKLFAKAFPGAQYVKWSMEGEQHKFSFLYNGKGAQALFDSKGKMIASVRNVLYADLPFRVMMSIRKRFENAIPFAMTEINRQDGTHYKFSIEFENRRYSVMVSADGSVNVITVSKDKRMSI